MANTEDHVDEARDVGGDLEPDVEVRDQEDVEFDDSPTADETLRYFGADFDVDGLVRRLNDRDITVPSFDPAPEEQTEYAGFQRKLIWTKKQKDRFIESLLLGYPVPGIFLVERAGRKYLVLDGQQRLRTLQEFKKGEYGDAGRERVFRLTYVGEHFKNHRYGDLKPADKRVLDNTFIQATVVVPKSPKAKSGVYQLFERINSGGTNLQPQEIRVALYAGARVDLIRELNYDPSWRKLFGPPHSRLKDNELILRYMALREVAKNLMDCDWDREELRVRSRDADGPITYKSPMSTFLNSYLDQFGETGTQDSLEVDSFRLACQALAQVGPETLRVEGARQVNAAHTDAVLVGLSLSPQLRDSPLPTEATIRDALDRLLGNEDYLVSIRESTSHAVSVFDRLEHATKVFANL